AALEAVLAEGRTGFYRGPFGDGLIDLGGGLFTTDDLDRSQAEWVEPLRVTVWGHDVLVPPPPSQAYLLLAGAVVAEGLPLPDDADDPRWPHLLAESARAVGIDRDAVLHEGADGAALLDPEHLAGRRAAIDPDRRADTGALTRAGGTTVCCAADRARMGVTLIQSNALGWGAHLVEPATGIFLHDRGMGFRLAPGHPAELAPGRRPPHTLSPALITRPDGSLRAVLGTMGGDSQPQILLQVLVRLLVHGESPARAVSAGRWSLSAGGGFETWEGDGPGHIALEEHAPEGWDAGLTARGHEVQRAPDWAYHPIGHAMLIEAIDGVLAGVADPRTIDGAASSY
ncbi:MAG TPA: gamma-glutamyltransferase, partial [Actinomycetota bacterium]|nr:gamma-glutamyltransferase [Actinomycetota bacterium]